MWPNDTTWWHKTGSTLAQVMACCLMATSHYLNQCWLIIREVPSHSSEGIINRRSDKTNQNSKIENCILKIASRSPRGQWDHFVVRTVSADGLTPGSVGTSWGIVMTKYESYKYKTGTWRVKKNTIQRTWTLGRPSSGSKPVSVFIKFQSATGS